MKIKNLRYIFGVVAGMLFFVTNVSFGACTSDMTSGSRTYPGNGHSSGNCWSIATQGDNRYNNNQELAGAELFLKLINVSWSSCNASTVGNIQTKMQQIGGNCSTCIDGRAGNKMRNSINNCVSKMCTGDLITPVLSGGGLACSLPDYTLIDHTAFGMTYKCCQEEEVGYEPVSPLITNTNSDWEGGVAHIVVQYQDYTADVDHRDQSMPAFGSSTGTLSNLNLNTSSLNVTFDVTNISDDVDSITVTVAPGLITFVGGSLSLGGSNTFNRTVPDSGSSGDCPAAPTNGSCGEGCAIVGSGCSPASTTCGSGEAAPGGSECKSCEEGTMANEEHTKCICDSSKKCCGIQLNTVVPFIGDCIEMNTNSSRGDTTSVTSVTAFPILVQGLMKILMSAIMVFSFLMIIIAGLSMITGAFGGSGYNKGKTIIKNVIISLILLGCSGLILSLINPSFFGG